MALERINTVMRVDQRRVGVYGATIYPASAKHRTPARVRMAVEVGDHPAVEFIERVRDGRMELGPDALGHADPGKALHRACSSEGVDFYRLVARLSLALEGMTRPLALSRSWVERELSTRHACLTIGADQAVWDVRHPDCDEQRGYEGFECLHDVAFAFGLAIADTQPRPANRG